MHVMYCALRVGFLDDIVIGCVVLLLPYAILVVEVFTFYTTRCAMNSLYPLVEVE
jgi:hypothetical protein